jgi:excisionase family DNA binding protein
LKTVYRAISRGDLRASKICSRLRVRQSDVDLWIERSQIESPCTPERSGRFAHPAANGLRALLPQMREGASR